MRWINILFFIIICSISVEANILGQGVFGSGFFGASRPIITLISPTNNSAITVSTINEQINFIFNVNKNSSVCNLYYNNIKIANSTNSLGTTTISASATGLGLSPWFVNCTHYQYNNVIGFSGKFNLEIVQGQQQGGGATPSSPSGGGGGGGNDISLPPPIDADTGKYIYSLSYICSKTKTFIQNHFVNGVYKGYTNDDLNTFQYSVLNDTGQSISKITLSDYIDYSESYCNVSKSSIKQSNTSTKTTLILNDSYKIYNLTSKTINITLNSYIPIFNLNLGYNYQERFPLIFYFMNILFRIKIIDDKYTIVGIRILTLITISVAVYLILFYKRIIGYLYMDIKYLKHIFLIYYTYIQNEIKLYTHYSSKKIGEITDETIKK